MCSMSTPHQTQRRLRHWRTAATTIEWSSFLRSNSLGFRSTRCHYYVLGKGITQASVKMQLHNKKIINLKYFYAKKIVWLWFLWTRYSCTALVAYSINNNDVSALYIALLFLRHFTLWLILWLHCTTNAIDCHWFMKGYLT